MRRIVAGLVLSVMAWSFVAPMAMALTGNDVPACCRRNGKHHCMSGMSGLVGSNDKAPAFRTIPSRCPFRSTVATLVPVAQMQVARTSKYTPSSAILAAGPEYLTVGASAHSLFFQRGPPTRSLHY